MARSAKIFGKKIKARREQLHLSQLQLGQAVGLTDEQISSIERKDVAGTLSKRIPAIAAALKVPLDEFSRDYVFGTLTIPVDRPIPEKLELPRDVAQSLADLADGSGLRPWDFLCRLIVWLAQGERFTKSILQAAVAAMPAPETANLREVKSSRLGGSRGQQESGGPKNGTSPHR